MKISLRREFVGALAAAAVALVVIAACTPPGTTPYPVAPAEAAGVPNPFTASEEVMEEGESLYLTVCATCHGYAADGFGPQYQLYAPRPSNFKLEEFQARADGTIFWQAWFGNTLLDEDDIGDLPHSLPQEAGDPSASGFPKEGVLHTEFKVSDQVRGAEDTGGGMTADEMWKVVHFLRTAPSR